MRYINPRFTYLLTYYKTDSWCMPAPCTVVLLQFYCRSGYNESARAPKGSAHSRLNVIVSREVICELSVLKIAKNPLAVGATPLLHWGKDTTLLDPLADRDLVGGCPIL